MEYVIISLESRNLIPEGEVLYIKANPVNDAGEDFRHLEERFGKKYYDYSMMECNETDHFILPFSESDLQRFITIAKRTQNPQNYDSFWSPNMNDFYKGKIKIQETGDVLEIYKHKDLKKSYNLFPISNRAGSHILTDARTLSEAIKLERDDEEIYQKWNILAKDLNSYFNYDDIPYIQEVSEAMFLYVSQYKCNQSPEEVIRVLTTLCLLKRAFDIADDSERKTCAMRLSIFMYKKYPQLIIAWYYTLPRDIANYSINDIPHDEFEYNQFQMLTNYYAIKKYLYDLVYSDEGGTVFEDFSLSMSFEKSNKPMLTKIKEGNKYINLSLNGKALLDLCCARLNEQEKYPMWITYNVLDITSESLGMIPYNFIFTVSSFIVDKPYNEEETDGKIIVKLAEGHLICDIEGLSNRFFPSHINQPYKGVYAYKKDHHVEIALEVDYGHLENISVISLHIIVERGCVTDLLFYSCFNRLSFTYIHCKGYCTYIDA